MMMNTKFARLSLPVALALILALFVGEVSPATATHVTPVVVPGNPDCADLGYSFGFKIDAQVIGNNLTFTFTTGTQHGYPTVVTSGPQDPNNSVTITSDGTSFDWSATLGIDAVIVKGGPNANVYEYDPEETSDTGLTTPAGQEISHIEFCYDYELTVSKDANTSFTRTFEWEIEKSVEPETWDLFKGDSGTSEYTVTVTKTGFTDSDWAVNGTITIDNNTPFDATITDVSDVVSPNIAADVDCNVSFPHLLESGDTLECTYETDLPDGEDRTNTATVTTSGDVGGGEDTADVTFGDPTTVVNDTINVEDTFEGDLGSFSDSGSTTYERTFTCNDDEGKHDNTATIVETEQSDDASVTVNCYELAVEKDADTSLTRKWTWTIEKSADQTDLLLSEGQLFQVNYEVTVDATSADSEHAVSGNITVENPAPIDATINGVSDLVSPNIAADVDCGVTFPYTLAAGGTLNCTYSTNLPDAEERTNTATATLQNYDYDSERNATASVTTDFSHTINVSFANATVDEVDECVEVSDTNAAFDGPYTVCAGMDTLPATFNYSLWFGAHPDADVVLECGENTHTNVADFVTNDTETTGEDDHTVNAEVACALGCTLTQGYWKTHSQQGPAPYDNAWQNVGPDEENTTFFLSGKSWYQVFWTPPAGNAYYNLAHQYMAAKLNVLNGASAPADVQTALSQAETLLNTYTPAQVAEMKPNNPVRKQFISLASTLDKYNNGLIGPGHCSE